MATTKTTTRKATRSIPCPACSGTLQYATEVSGVQECKACGAIHGTCYRGDAYTFYLPYWHQGPDGETRYIDLTMLGSTVEQFHGWVNKETKRIVQTG